MTTHNQFLPISSTRKFFVLLTLALLLGSVYIVNAQDNTNNTNLNANRGGATPTPTSTPAPTATPAPTPTPSPTPVSAVEARQTKLSGTSWFPAIIILMFATVLIGFAYTITRAIRFSKETFRSKSGMPEGSLRAMLAFTLVSFLGFYVLASILSFSDFKPPEFLLGIVATVIGFYFGSRTGEDKAAGGAASRTGSVKGNVTDKTGTAAGGASVELTQSDGKKLTQKADATGKYTFDAVPVGDHVVQASLTGHTPSDQEKATVTADKTTTVNLKLK